MKTKEELNELKQKFDNLNKEIQELSEDELDAVTGGQTYVIAGAGIAKVSADDLKGTVPVRVAYLDSLSGGQKQRAATTEAMTPGTKIVVMKDGVIQ